ncbi:MAG: hypothetical protein EA400_00225 [Chromatiaceae bacterium]|nr:MAG: hypothetical protein EA400_00225 [Chromatiaceae bacterium]
MNESDAPKRQWLLRLQSAYVLPLARGVYLLIALACLVTIVGGALYVLLLQASAAGTPTQEPLPPAYRGTAVSPDLPAREIDLAAVQRRLAAPEQILFAVTTGPITEPPAEGAVLGEFRAGTANALAAYPDGISILGGPDAPLFERVPGTARGAIGLAPRPELIAQLGEQLEGLQAPQSRRFELRVIARDQYGITSAPADVSVTLQLAPAQAGAPEVPAAEPIPEQALTEVQRIARDIAQTLEPTVNPDHFAVYRTASEVPGRCGVRDDDQAFLASYRRAFEDLRERLTSGNIEAFYLGLCEGWGTTLQRETAARQRAEQQAAAERRAAEQARSMVEQRNAQALRAHAAKVERARAQSAVVLSVIGGALATFLSVALVLAFLAIEGHSRAVRAAVEAMARSAQPAPGGGEAPGGA